jgi:hypothetical protein
MHPGNSDRRKHVRRTVLLPCRMENPATSPPMHVINLSTGGCLVAARDTVVQPGGQLTLYVKFDDVELPLTGRVVHARSGWGFALEFVNLASQTQHHIEQFLAMEAITGGLSPN